MLSKYMMNIVNQGAKVGYKFGFDNTIHSTFITFYDYMGHLVHFHSWATASRFFTNPSRKREFEAYGARAAT